MYGTRHWLSTIVIILSVFHLGCSERDAERGRLLIVAFGNSTTAPRAHIDEVYPDRLSLKLDSGKLPNRVVNAGLGGSHAGFLSENNRFELLHGRDRFEQDVLKLHPDWVIIWFGINDSWVDSDTSAGQSRIPLSAYQAHLTHYVETIREQGGRTILLTPNPLGERYEQWRHERLGAYRHATLAVAEETNCLFLDVWDLCQRYTQANGLKIDDLLLDGMHPNDRMHELIADTLSKKLLTITK